MATAFGIFEYLLDSLSHMFWFPLGMPQRDRQLSGYYHCASQFNHPCLRHPFRLTPERMAEAGMIGANDLALVAGQL